MSLIKCLNCRKEFSREEINCPNCRKERSQKEGLGIIGSTLAIIIIFCLYLYASNVSEQESNYFNNEEVKGINKIILNKDLVLPEEVAEDIIPEIITSDSLRIIEKYNEE